jgi:hypothetical protein
MTDLPRNVESSANFTRLQPCESAGQQIGFGLVGIILFALFGAVAYSVSRELNGLSAIMALAASIVFFLLSAAALYGTIHVGLSARVAAPYLELESLKLTRKHPVAGRLVQKGPASFDELRVVLVCTQTEFQEASRETRRSIENEGPHEIETITVNHGETELARIELVKIERLWAVRGEEVVHPFTVDVPKDAVATGNVQVSEFVFYSYDWKLIVEGDILGPNSKQEYDVVVD